MVAVVPSDFDSPFCEPWNPILQAAYASRRSFRDYACSIFDPNNKCLNCDAQTSVCLCGSTGQPPFLTFSRDIYSSRNGNSNAARPAQRQEMESSSGAGAVTAAPLSEDPYTNYQGGRMTLSGSANVEATEKGTMIEQLLARVPSPSQHVGPDRASNVRSSAGGDDVVGADDEAARTLNILATWPTNTANEDNSLHAPVQKMNGTSMDLLQSALELDDQDGHATLVGGTASYEVPTQYVTEAQFDSKNAKAYAKLVFADGDLFITTHDVMLGRNMERFEQMRRRKKQERRAREELDTYRKEPSQPSQPGDEDQQGVPSNSSQSLEGRPAPPSNFSEHGGPVWYPPHSDGEGEAMRSKPKRRISHFSKSSSTTSVAPANLHTSSISDLSNPYNEPDVRTFAFIPIHTPAAEDISKISKEHLMFSFNFQDEQWELKVVGNRAFINEELFEKGTVVPLRHNDEILIATVHMVFKLPDNFRQSPGLSRGTFSRDSEDEELSDEEENSLDQAVSTSPVRRLSNALDAEDEESEQEQQVETKDGRKKPKLRLQAQAKKTKLKGKNVTGKTVSKKHDGKKPMRKESQDEGSPKAVKKPDKGKKPKMDENEAAETVKTERASTPTVPFIKPGSALEGIPVEDLPDKRKGPGRPPKEGNVSKRDMGFAKKKLKEYEKRGEEPPPFREIVTMVRRENKIREMQAKMVANGQLEPGADVVPSIEPEAGGNTARVSAATNDSTTAAPTESARRSPPRPKRAVRALSPVKPEEECTEEDLKKPDRTYVHILDEVLQGNAGPADLPEIYERMQKRHPYFKYKCKTLGWQSSVRHNLQQSLRFKEVGKAGKGKLWSVDVDVPLEKEKKRKTTPPKQVMHNGQFVPGQMPHPQYGPAPYGNPYGPHQPNGQPPPGMPPGNATYYSPYGQQYGGHPPPNGMQQPQTYPGNQTSLQHRAHGAIAAPQEQLPQHMTKLVDELIQFHSRHVAQYNGDTPEQDRQKKLLHNVMEYLSAYFHDKEPNATIAEAMRSDAHKPLYESLEKVFRRHRPDLVAPNPFDGGPMARPQDGPANNGAAVDMPANDLDAASVDSKHQSQEPLVGTDSSLPGAGTENLPPTIPASAETLNPTPAPTAPNTLKRAAEEDASGSEAKRRRMPDT